MQNSKFFRSTINYELITMNLQRGQALVSLLVFVVIAVTISSAAIVIIIINSQSASKYQDGLITYYIAESGLENAIIRLLRDPNYLGETVSVGSGSATIVVSGSNPKIATSTGTLGNYKRKIQVQMNYNSGSYTYTNWKEVP